MPADPLFPATTQIEKHLSVRMTVGRVALERLQVAVDPQGADRPIPAA